MNKAKNHHYTPTDFKYRIKLIAKHHIPLFSVTDIPNKHINTIIADKHSIKLSIIINNFIASPALYIKFSYCHLSNFNSHYVILL